MNLGLSLTGRIRLPETKKAGRAGAFKGLLIGGEHVLGVSNEHVPHEEGDLERTGVVSSDEPTLDVAVSYDTDYAPDQHENLTYAHDSGRTAKFLERALHSEAKTVSSIVARQVEAELKNV